MWVRAVYLQTVTAGWCWHRAWSSPSHPHGVTNVPSGSHIPGIYIAQCPGQQSRLLPTCHCPLFKKPVLDTHISSTTLEPGLLQTIGCIFPNLKKGCCLDLLAVLLTSSLLSSPSFLSAVIGLCLTGLWFCPRHWEGKAKGPSPSFSALVVQPLHFRYEPTEI